MDDVPTHGEVPLTPGWVIPDNLHPAAGYCAGCNPSLTVFAECYRASPHPTVNPMDNPAGTPKKRKDQGPKPTFKGDEFVSEFRALNIKAAERSGMSQSAFLAETLRREAQRIIKDIPAETPQLSAVQAEHLDDPGRRIAELADQIGKLVALQPAAQQASFKATLWARVRAALRGARGGDRVAARVDGAEASTPPVTPASIPQAA